MRTVEVKHDLHGYNVVLLTDGVWRYQIYFGDDFNNRNDFIDTITEWLDNGVVYNGLLASISRIINK